MTSRHFSTVLIVFCFGVTACSSASDDPGTASASSDAVTTSVATTAAASATTETSVATTSEPTPTSSDQTEPSDPTTTIDTSLRVSPGERGSSDLGAWNAEERDIIHTGHIYWDLIIRSLNSNQADPADPDYVLHVNGPTRRTLQNLATKTLTLGESTEGPAILQPISVAIDGNTAILIECVLDAVDTLNADGSVHEPADLEPSMWESIIVWQDPFWQTNEFRRIDGTCELDDRYTETVPFANE